LEPLLRHEEFGLAIYLEQARTAIDAIRAKGKAPVLVGGTGQYVWALLEGWTVPRVPPDIGFRRHLEEFAATEGTAALHARLQNADPGSRNNNSSAKCAASHTRSGGLPSYR